MADDRIAAWHHELYSWWAYYNLEFLQAALRRPLIVIAKAQTTLGTWRPAERTISIAESHIQQDPWLAVMETLRHEMAHQYAWEVAGARDEPPHGNAFQAACQRLRTDPRATSCGHAHARHPDLPESGSQGRIASIVAKLLSLGQSPNEHEAEAAIRKARHLLLKHNIQLVEVDTDRRFAAREIGPVRARHHTYEYGLARVLNEFFFVEVIWLPSYDTERARKGSVLQAYGTEANLDMAEYVYSYLTALLPALWQQYKHDNGIRGDRERLRYFAGVVQGLLAKLGTQDVDLREQEALVWIGDSRLKQFYRYHNPRIRWTTTGGVTRTAAYQDGRRDGGNVTIHKPIRGGTGDFGGYLAE